MHLCQAWGARGNLVKVVALVHSWVTRASAGWGVRLSQAQMSVIYDDAYVSKTGLGRRRWIGCRNQVSGLGFLLQKQAHSYQHKQCSTTTRKLWWISALEINVHFDSHFAGLSPYARTLHRCWRWETVIFLFIYTLLSCSYLSLPAQKDYGSPEWAFLRGEIFLNHHGSILMMLNQLQGNDDMADLI